MNHIMEIARFSVVDGVESDTVPDRARIIDGWLGRQTGFVRRTLVGPDDEGRWTDLVEWRSRDDAMAAAAAIGQDPELEPFMAIIDSASVEMRHIPVVATLEGVA